MWKDINVYVKWTKARSYSKWNKSIYTKLYQIKPTCARKYNKISCKSQKFSVTYREVGIFEKSWKGGSRFSCKNRGLSIKGRGGGSGKQSLSLIMYGFCSSNAPHSARFSFGFFIFLMTPFDTWDCYYFGCL